LISNDTTLIFIFDEIRGQTDLTIRFVAKVLVDSRERGSASRQEKIAIPILSTAHIRVCTEAISAGKFHREEGFSGYIPIVRQRIEDAESH
jgi:hypothetical protein